MSDTPTVFAWQNATELVDETLFTPWADEGWLSWNGQSPEVAICGFVQMLIEMIRPTVILETGVGQGYLTRAIVPILRADEKLIAYESDDNWREALWSLPFWQDNRVVVTLSPEPTPSPDLIVAADLCIFDSEFENRFQEVSYWDHYAKEGAVCLIHDTSDHPDTVHNSLREFILQMGMTGTFLKNPRGCFMAVQGRRPDGREESPSQEDSNED